MKQSIQISFTNIDFRKCKDNYRQDVAKANMEFLHLSFDGMQNGKERTVIWDKHIKLINDAYSTTLDWHDG